jgi:hypothetical protein
MFHESFLLIDNKGQCAQQLACQLHHNYLFTIGYSISIDFHSLDWPDCPIKKLICLDLILVQEISAGSGCSSIVTFRRVTCVAGSGVMKYSSRKVVAMANAYFFDVMKIYVIRAINQSV